MRLGGYKIQENWDYVSYTPGELIYWTLVVSGRAKRISEECREIIEITGTLLDQSADLFIPTCIDFNLLACNEDYPSNYVFKGLCGVYDNVTVESEKGVSSDALRDALKDALKKSVAPRDRTLCIRRVEINRGKTRFILRGADTFVDRNSFSLYRPAPNDDQEDNDRNKVYRLPWDPIDISITHLPPELIGLHSETNADHAFYEIVFRSSVNIWFEKTEIGRANRNRLRNVMKRIISSLDIVKMSFADDWYGEKAVRVMILGED